MLSRWQSTIVDAQGNVQPLANLTVRNEADQSLAKMWASPGTSQPLPDGMVQADGNGYAFFYAEGGLYRITSVALGIDWRAVPLGELAGMDVADLGTAATRDVGTAAGTVAAGDDSRITGAAQTSSLGTAAFADIVGTMAGGSIIESGSNANGRFWRNAAGLQVCESTGVAPVAVTRAEGSLYRSQAPELSGAYPAPFSDAPSVFIRVVVYADDTEREFHLWTGPGNADDSLTSFNSVVLSPVSGTYTVRYKVLAVGPWFNT